MNNFFDSNILLYLVEDIPKTVLAENLSRQGGTISVQVLNEFVSVCRKIHKLEFSDIVNLLLPIKETFRIVDVTIETHERAMEIAMTNKIGIYDANIVAAAELAGCDTLYTEDLSDGQRIGRVTIRNPFM